LIPAGVVWKLEHILDVRDARFKDEVKIMAPAADEIKQTIWKTPLKRQWR
jgi:hypothetical protein